VTKPGCPDCAEAGQRAKAQGFRDWRTGYACYECAAFDLDSPEGRALMADVTPEIQAKAAREMAAFLRPRLPAQPDLFAA